MKNRSWSVAVTGGLALQWNPETGLCMRLLSARDLLAPTASTLPARRTHTSFQTYTRRGQTCPLEGGKARLVNCKG